MIHSNRTIAAIATRLGLLGAAAGGIALAVVGVPATATPGSGFAPSPLAVGVLAETMIRAENLDKAAKAANADHWDLMLKTGNDSTVGVDNISVQPGGFSGWHKHAGITVVTVASGQINWVDGVTCTMKTYRAGDTFIEPAGRPHNVKNPYGNTATFAAVQMRPVGTGPRIDVPVAPPNCNL